MFTSGVAVSAGAAMLCNPVSGNGSSPAGGTLPTTAGGSAASSAANGRAGSASAGLAGSTAGMAEPAAPATGGPTSNSGTLPGRVPPASAAGMAGAAAEFGAMITPAWSGTGTPAPAGATTAPQPDVPTSAFPSACAKPFAVPSVLPGIVPVPRGGAVIGKLSSTSMIGSGPPARHGPAEWSASRLPTRANVPAAIPAVRPAGFAAARHASPRFTRPNPGTAIAPATPPADAPQPRRVNPSLPSRSPECRSTPR
jgi:hypothetical protein